MMYKKVSPESITKGIETVAIQQPSFFLTINKLNTINHVHFTEKPQLDLHQRLHT